jgi:hypothetical protein
MKKPKTAVPFPGLDKVRGEVPPAAGYDPHETRTYWKVRWPSQKERIALRLDLIADAVLAYRAAARTKKAKKRQRARRKIQRESSI